MLLDCRLRGKIFIVAEWWFSSNTKSQAAWFCVFNQGPKTRLRGSGLLLDNVMDLNRIYIPYHKIAEKIQLQCG